MLKIQKSAGMTLLELLLVIAISASLMVGTFSFIQIKAERVKADKTILEMQQWAQAAVAYYVVNKYLPENDIKDALVRANFMPSNVSDANPWGKPYQLTFNSKVIGVNTRVPSRDAVIIQGNLPGGLPVNNDQNTSKMTTVSLQVTAPLSDTASVQYANIVAGTPEYPATVAAPNCPANMNPEIFAAPVMFSSIGNAYPISQVGAYARVAETKGDKVTQWNVYSTLYTVNGPEIRTGDAQQKQMSFRNYNKVLIMTKCTPIVPQIKAEDADKLMRFF